MRVRSDEVLVWVEVFSSQVGVVVDDLVDVYFVAKEATNATEALHELMAFLGLVGNQLNFDTEVTVVHAEPVAQRFRLDNLEVDSTVCILEVLRVALLVGSEVPGLGLAVGWIFDDVSHMFDFVPQE